MNFSPGTKNKNIDITKLEINGSNMFLSAAQFLVDFNSHGGRTSNNTIQHHAAP